MSDTPEYDLLVRDFGPRFDESPWSPELLEPPDFDLPPRLPVHLTALLTPTQTMETIDDGDRRGLEGAVGALP